MHRTRPQALTFMVDLSGLRNFNVAALMTDATGKALSLPVAKIDFDPDNVRTKITEESIAELAAGIKAQGLLQPISVRRHPKKKHHYVVNFGERRLRAVKLLGHDNIDAYVHDEFDPYAQAAENIQREELSAMDVARFVAKRETEGESRATIARKLGKPASFITEAARLATAPKIIVEAYDDGRIPDTRTVYMLAKAYDERPSAVRELLAGDSPLTREGVAIALDPFSHEKTAPTEKNGGSGTGKAKGLKPWNAMVVLVNERQGVMRLRPGKSKTSAAVVFDDGSEEVITLTEMTLQKWTHDE